MLSMPIAALQWMCFDATPLPGCLPYTAKRMAKLTPNAKLIFMVGPSCFFGRGISCWKGGDRK
jgi:hypothetical protein